MQKKIKHDQIYDNALRLIEFGHSNIQALDDALDLARNLRDIGMVEVDDKKIYDEQNFKDAADISKRIRSECAGWIKEYGDEKAVSLYRKTLLFDAPFDFDCYCRFIEFDREPRKRFYEPRRKQLKKFVDALQDLEDGRLELLTISCPPGVGKALANDTPILTMNGWKKHGDLVVGDEVIGMDGNFKKVVAVHPKYMLDRLVEFTNGEKIVCHENHEWMVYDRPRRGKNATYVAETKRLEKRRLEHGGESGHRGHRYTLQLPKRDYVVGEEKDLPVEPYTLGVWLGDGTNQAPRICCAKADKAVIDRVQRTYKAKREWAHKTTGVLYFEFDLRKQLRSLGMCHSKRRIPKRVPEEYLTASVNQRLELLAGLLDTDGTLSGSKYQFTTSEETLRDTFAELVSTFGWRYSVSYHEPTTSSSGITARKGHYVIGFTPDCTIPCELERKRNYDPHPQRAIAFKSITKTEPVEGNCITVEGDGMYLAGRTMVPTHNTTLALFFITWVSGRNPNLSTLMGSHSSGILRGMFSELQRIFQVDGEYNYNEVFPRSPLVNTNSKDLQLDLARTKRFSTIQMTSPGASNAGKSRASNYLYCDDLVEGLETAMSADRLDKLWQQYAVDLRQRKIGTAKELHIATRWSVRDVIGRLESQYEDDPKARFLSFPAMDEHDESMWDYPYNLGFTTKYFREQREIMDEVSWKCIFENQPIERSGLLFYADELRRYYSLPEEEPDNIIAVCDTKDTGPDYCVLPIAYRYGDDFFIEYILCDNGKPEAIEERIVNALIEHNVRFCQFESNRGAGRIAESVQEKVRQRGGVTRITTKWTQSNKESRIIAQSPIVKQYCLFKAESEYSKEYRTAITMLCGWTMAGKNKHDDVPDAFSMLAEFIMNQESGRATLMQRFF